MSGECESCGEHCLDCTCYLKNYCTMCGEEATWISETYENYGYCDYHSSPRRQAIFDLVKKRKTRRVSSEESN